MSQAKSKRSKSELELAEGVVHKVRLVTQPEFGHELRQAQQTIAELKGQVIQWEWVGRTAKSRAARLEGELTKLKDERDKLAEEVMQLQESESDEVQRLGTENVALSRRASRNDVELQTLRNLVQALGLSEAANSAFSVPGQSVDGEGGSSSGCGNKDESSSQKQDDGNREGSDNEEIDLCDRESSVLRSVEAEPARNYRSLYPIDALASDEARKWFPQAFAYLDVDLGPGYLDLLIKWIDFERFHQWEKSGGRLDKTERPKEITAWITEGRYQPRCKGPQVGVDFIKTFPERMRKWWDSLRSSTPLHQGEVDDDGRASLNKHGINGWFSIVAGMKWWGEGLKSLSGDRLRNGTEDWLTMITELTAALDTLKKHE
ncbi:SERTA domain-containing protein 3 [Stygiomarasmius scandens]|uniref:SERTA domain-containing protein 3 n=1 Tax=Marasmiellus scandens TaxID=2682957 RepID=A0ABR1J4U4_9AGAR